MLLTTRLTLKSTQRIRTGTLTTRTVSSCSLLPRLNHLYFGRLGVIFPSAPFALRSPNLLRTSTDKRNMSVFNASRLVGKTVLLTGASSGIGAVRRSRSSHSIQVKPLRETSRPLLFCSLKYVFNRRGQLYVLLINGINPGWLKCHSDRSTC
jgi:hypothetical protein